MTKRRKAYQKRRNRPKAGKWLITSEKIAQDARMASGEHLEMFIPYEGWEPVVGIKSKLYKQYCELDKLISPDLRIENLWKEQTLNFIERITQSFRRWFKNNK